ncbi:MAG: response regulator [Richelia sp. CSU_2_1]|nr:response regulator [Richelia sp. CSU_2_1]
MVLICLIENSPDDVEVAQYVFDDCGLEIDLEIYRDGRIAIFELGRSVSPDLILLDWHLGRASGLEVLQFIKNHPELKKVPTVIFSTSKNETDILNAYQNYCNSFLIKPLGLDETIKALKDTVLFFCQTSMLPPK